MTTLNDKQSIQALTDYVGMLIEASADEQAYRKYEMPDWWNNIRSQLGLSVDDVISLYENENIEAASYFTDIKSVAPYIFVGGPLNDSIFNIEINKKDFMIKDESGITNINYSLREIEHMNYRVPVFAEHSSTEDEIKEIVGSQLRTALARSDKTIDFIAFPILDVE